MLALAVWILTWHAGSVLALQEAGAAIDSVTRERVVGVVLELRTALREKDFAGAWACLDLGALLNGALALEPHPDSKNLLWRWGVTTGWVQGLADEAELQEDELSVRSVHRTADGFEVVTHTVDSEGIDTYEGWQIADRDGTARIVDTLDLDMGTKASDWLAASLWLERHPGLDMDVWLAVVEEAEYLLDIGLYEDARELLEDAPAGWPAPMAQTLEIFHLGILLGQERWQAALERIAKMEEANPRALLMLHLRAQALNGLGRHAEAEEVIETYVRTVGGRDATTRLHGARALAGQGKHAEAREVLGLALDADPNDDELVYELALSTPRWDPGPLRERFLAMDDPRAAFEPLAIAFLDGGHFDAAEALCRIQREADPEDPNTGYYLGRLHLELEQYESAARALREALLRAPEEELEAYQQLFLDACFGMGVALSGYEPCRDRRSAFRYLAEGVLGSEGPDGLRRAIELHREHEPDDPWIAYYEDVLAWHTGEREESLRLLRAGMEGAEERPGLREAYRSALVAGAIEEGQARTIWQTVEPVDESFDQVLGAAFDERDLELFRDLLRDRKEARREDPLLTFYRALRLHLEGDHEQALERLEWSHDAVERHGAHVFRRDQAFVVSALRTERVEDARRRALSIQEGWDDDYLLLLVHLETDEHERALTLLRRMLRRGWYPWALYADELVGERLREHEAYEELRAEYPPLEEEADEER